MNEFSRFVKWHDLKITDGCSICQNNPEEAASLPLLLLPQESAEIYYLPYQGGRLLLISEKGQLHSSLLLPLPLTHCLSAMVPAHICRELCRTGAFFFFFFSPGNRISVFLWVSCLPCPLSFMVLLRNTLLLQSFSTRSVWQSVGVKPGLYQSTAVKSYLIERLWDWFFPSEVWLICHLSQTCIWSSQSSIMKRE